MQITIDSIQTLNKCLMFSRTYVKEDHGSPLFGVQFNHYLKPEQLPIFASVGANRVSVYRCLKNGSMEMVQCYADPDVSDTSLTLILFSHSLCICRTCISNKICWLSTDVSSCPRFFTRAAGRGSSRIFRIVWCWRQLAIVVSFVFSTQPQWVVIKISLGMAMRSMSSSFIQKCHTFCYRLAKTIRCDCGILRRMYVWPYLAALKAIATKCCRPILICVEIVSCLRAWITRWSCGVWINQRWPTLSKIVTCLMCTKVSAPLKLSTNIFRIIRHVRFIGIMVRVNWNFRRINT